MGLHPILVVRNIGPAAVDVKSCSALDDRSVTYITANRRISSAMAHPQQRWSINTGSAILPPRNSIGVLTGGALMTGVVTTLIGLAVLICAGVAASVVVLLQRKNRRQIALLEERLNVIEIREFQNIEHFVQDSQGDIKEKVTVANNESNQVQSRDPLSGRTTEVRLLVSGSKLTDVLADEAIVWISNHLQTKLAPSDAAQGLGVSLRTLERGVAEALNCSPSWLILALKMREARWLITSGEMQISQAAKHLGFNTPQHFSRRFKAFFHKTPSQMVSKTSR
jgi:AraC-like DNA-binding protein